MNKKEFTLLLLSRGWMRSNWSSSVKCLILFKCHFSKVNKSLILRPTNQSLLNQLSNLEGENFKKVISRVKLENESTHFVCSLSISHPNYLTDFCDQAILIPHRYYCDTIVISLYLFVILLITVDHIISPSIIV
jgi:hypothetical protein